MLNSLGKVFLVADPATAVFDTCCFTVVVIHVDQINVTGYVQLARAQFAHADNP